MANYNVPTNPTFSDQVRKFETTDPAHADVFNNFGQAIFNNECALQHNKSEKSNTTQTTITGADWTGTEPFWENTINITGVTATNNVEILLSPTATVDDVKECQKAQISVGTQGAGYITLKSASDSKPTADIPIVVIVRGD